MGDHRFHAYSPGYEDSRSGLRRALSGGTQRRVGDNVKWADESSIGFLNKGLRVKQQERIGRQRKFIHGAQFI
jgi:hypothetical protein